MLRHWWLCMAKLLLLFRGGVVDPCLCW
jgi:hypothetical protein